MAKTFKKVAESATDQPAPKTAKSPTAKTASAPVQKTSKAKTAPAADADETPAKERSGKHIGRTSGMRIMQFQDHTLMQQDKRRLTDEELGAEWAEEFPEARCQFAERMDIVRRVRQLFNEGRHGKQEQRPAKPVPKYEIQNGKRVAVVEEPRRRGKAASEAA